MYCLSNDIRGYRSLYLTAKEAHDKLGEVAEQYLEQRGVTVLEQAFNTLCDSIEVGCIYKGIEPGESGILSLQVQSKVGERFNVTIGTMTMVNNAYRLLSPTWSVFGSSHPRQPKVIGYIHINGFSTIVRNNSAPMESDMSINRQFVSFNI